MTDLLTELSVVELTGALGDTCTAFLASLGARVTRVTMQPWNGAGVLVR